MFSFSKSLSSSEMLTLVVKLMLGFAVSEPYLCNAIKHSLQAGDTMIQICDPFDLLFFSFSPLFIYLSALSLLFFFCGVRNSKLKLQFLLLSDKNRKL